MNLISRNTEVDADRIHFADAIAAAQIIGSKSSSKVIYDIGSGNGIPGLVLGAMFPDRAVYCLDSNSKKIEALKYFVTQMGLKNVKPVAARFEDLKPGSVECCVSRGFASIAKTLLLARKPLALNGQYFHMKSSSWSKELGELPTQMFRHWSAKEHVEYHLPDSDQRMSVVITTKIKE